MNNEIILESHPDLTCNTWPLFELMLKERLNERTRISWLVNEPKVYENEYKDVKNVYFIKIRPTSLVEKIGNYIRCYRAQCIVTSNRHVCKNQVGKNQLNIYLTHGTPIKDIKEMIRNSGFQCDYLISQGPFLDKILMEQYNLKKEQVICLGYPRNDIMFTKPKSISRLYADAHTFSKIILWTPTFREHIDGKRVDVDTHFPLGMPILYTVEAVHDLNFVLLKEDTLLIIKPHPAQDISVLKDLKVSNIRFLYNSDLEKCNIQTNELLPQTDALITDYSSIYFDYLLLDKPIGITLDDYEQYKEQMGFSFKNPFEVLRGDHIYKLQDLICFVQRVSQNIDESLSQRIELKNKIQVKPVCDSSRRVYDFVMQKLKM